METAVLMLVFNRPELTARVFERVRHARPIQLFVAADGPRFSVPGEKEKCDRTREIVTNIDWDCDVKTLFRDQNLGCGVAVSGAIDWFFSHVHEGLILEDDCLPRESFFSFCEQMLGHYREEKRVMHICGSNHQNGVIRGDGSYYFSRYSHVWGWATWKDRWDTYDYTLSSVRGSPRNDLDRGLRALMDLVIEGHLDTWDVQWFMSVWFQEGMSVTPNVSMIENLGFGEYATHTRRQPSWLTGMQYGDIHDIKHPSLMKVDVSADKYVYRKMFRRIFLKRKAILAINFLRRHVKWSGIM